jgi:hypothetical protein
MAIENHFALASQADAMLEEKSSDDRWKLVAASTEFLCEASSPRHRSSTAPFSAAMKSPRIPAFHQHQWPVLYKSPRTAATSHLGKIWCAGSFATLLETLQECWFPLAAPLAAARNMGPLM